MKKPLIDFALGLKLAHNQADLAHQILHCLAKTLPNDIQKIETALLQKDSDAVHAAVHRLHGAICYCGTPRLLDAIQNLQHDLKNQTDLSLIDLTHLKEEARLTQEAIAAI